MEDKSFKYVCPYCSKECEMFISNKFSGVVGNICKHCGNEIAISVRIKKEISISKFDKWEDFNNGIE